MQREKGMGKQKCRDEKEEQRIVEEEKERSMASAQGFIFFVLFL